MSVKKSTNSATQQSQPMKGPGSIKPEHAIEAGLPSRRIPTQHLQAVKARGEAGVATSPTQQVHTQKAKAPTEDLQAPVQPAEVGAPTISTEHLQATETGGATSPELQVLHSLCAQRKHKSLPLLHKTCRQQKQEELQVLQSRRRQRSRRISESNFSSKVSYNLSCNLSYTSSYCRSRPALPKEFVPNCDCRP